VSFSDRGLALRVNEAATLEAFPSGTKVRGSYGDHSGFCRFDSEVISVTPGATTEDPVTIRLVPPARIATTQRRRFVRAGVELRIACALLDRKAMTFLSAPGDVDNLGGGGLKMIIAAHKSLVVGSQLAMALPMPGTEVLVLGRVVQLLIEPDKPATVRVAFTSIDADDRERIERFAYRKVGGTAPAKLWASGKIISTRPSPASAE
jgi:c-di-GMP-binding flagellar brake protein YcgR